RPIRSARRPSDDAVMRAPELLFASLALAACGGNDVSRARGALIGGTVDTGDRAVVALAIFDGASVELDCSGTLIAPKSILTAAHCVEQLPRGTTEYAVFLDHLPDTVGADFVEIAQGVANPRWDGSGSSDDDDIGVLELATAMTAI